ncbi:hypothetical protein BAE44_0023764, partial [Dichanthelium oligosanthes]
RRRAAVSNGHCGTERKDNVACVGGESEPVAVKAEEERVTSNGDALLQLALVPAVAVRQDEGKASSNGSGGGAKKRRGQAVLLEGSRCSRVNGSGWRCRQPTHSLCELHLGKGRMRIARNLPLAATATADHVAGRPGRRRSPGSSPPPPPRPPSLPLPRPPLARTVRTDTRNVPSRAGCNGLCFYVLR